MHLQIIKVDSEQSMVMARDLAKKEGLLVGISSGAAVHVSLNLIGYKLLFSTSSLEIRSFSCSLSFLQ